MPKFFVEGMPVAKGSLKAFINRKNGRPIILHNNPDEQKAWSSSIAYASQQKGIVKKEGCSIGLYLSFYMKRPKAHYRKNGEMKESCLDLQHTKKPDIDKLCRLVMDALTGIAYSDDSQVCYIEAEKYYANDDSDFKTGVMIEICQTEQR